MPVREIKDAMGSDFLLCYFGVDLSRQCRDGVCTAVYSRQELPDGAAMPLGKFQEDMCVGESLPIALA
jgi:hypothetical protein